MRPAHLLLLPLALSLVAARARPGRAPIVDAPRWIDEGPQAQLALLELFMESGDLERSLELIRVMRDQDREPGLLDLYQGIVMRDAGMTEEATELLDRASRSLPRDSRVPEARCVLYANESRVADALIECERATRMDKNSASSWNNYGWLLLGAGREPEALLAIQEAVRINGAEARYRTNLGLAQASVGKEELALRTLRTVGSEADAQYNIGTARERIDDIEGATDWYERAARSDPYHKASHEALARLTETP